MRLLAWESVATRGSPAEECAAAVSLPRNKRVRGRWPGSVRKAAAVGTRQQGRSRWMAGCRSPTSS